MASNSEPKIVLVKYRVMMNASAANSRLVSTVLLPLSVVAVPPGVVAGSSVAAPGVSAGGGVAS